MAIQEKTNASGASYTEIWTGTAGAPHLAATFTTDGLELPAGDTLEIPIATHGTSVQTPLVIAGNADAAVTARTGGAVRGPDVATGGAGNVAGANLTIRPGKGTGTGTPGTIVLQAAPVASSGDNAQTPATVVTIGAAALTMAASTSLVVATQTPASAAASGVAGTIAWDSSFIYVCVATNTWKRVAIATW